MSLGTPNPGRDSSARALLFMVGFAPAAFALHSGQLAGQKGTGAGDNPPPLPPPCPCVYDAELGRASYDCGDMPLLVHVSAPPSLPPSPYTPPPPPPPAPPPSPPPPPPPLPPPPAPPPPPRRPPPPSPPPPPQTPAQELAGNRDTIDVIEQSFDIDLRCLFPDLGEATCLQSWEFTDLSFQSATLVLSNLGGQGGRCQSITYEEEAGCSSPNPPMPPPLELLPSPPPKPPFSLAPWPPNPPPWPPCPPAPPVAPSLNAPDTPPAPCQRSVLITDIWNELCDELEPAAGDSVSDTEAAGLGNMHLLVRVILPRDPVPTQPLTRRASLISAVAVRVVSMRARSFAHAVVRRALLGMHRR